jgi:Ca-activated chloride channel homolog
MDALLSTWFAHPRLLATLAALPILSVLFLYAWVRRRRALTALGTALGVRRQMLMRAGTRRWRGLCLYGGILLLGVACAGPQWGREYGQSRAATSDLVVVLDLSRSMQAEQPSRQERALRLLRDLADTLQERGGRRVALVVFAAEARLLFPLTADYDHLRHSLRQVEKDDLPPLVPGLDSPFQSGTRIGAALRLAVATADIARGGRQAILLLSDGDDPAAGDEEWLEGVQEARIRAIRVHTVGVGDPDQEFTIPNDGDVLRYQGKAVRTVLNETLLKEIARRTGGAYVPAHIHAVPLGTIVTNLLAEQPSGDDTVAEDALPVYRQQYAWFLVPAILLLLWSLLCNEGPPRVRARRPVPATAAVLAVLLFTAATPDVDPLVRQGNAAFADGDFETALAFYDRAERSATDPGLVAFNRAAASFRLGRFAEAVAGYRQSLEDDQSPPSRRARAQYDLGTALVKQSGGASAALLRQAVNAFRACLAQPELDADLAKDARHNLELAQLLWMRARTANPNEDPGDGASDRPPDPKSNRPSGSDPRKQDENGPPSKDRPEPSPQPGDEGKAALGDGAKDKLNAGPLQMLPDSDEVRPLPPAEADEQLARIIERIVRERRLHWQQSARPTKDARNW